MEAQLYMPQTLKRIKDSLRQCDLTPLYLVGLAILLTVSCLTTTKMKWLRVSGISLTEYFDLVCFVGVMLVYGYAALCGRYRWWELAAITVVIAAAAYSAHVSQNHIILWMAAAVVCARGIPMNRVAGLYIIVNCALLFLAFVLVREGWIKHVVITSGGAKRYALGTLHPNNLGAHIFFLCATLSYLHRERLGVLDICIDLAAIAFCYLVPRSRGAMIVTGMLLVATIVWVIWRHRSKARQRLSSTPTSRWFTIAMGSIPLICASVSMWFAVRFDAANPQHALFDHLLSYRLTLGSMALDMYPIQPLGQYLALHQQVGYFADFTVDNWYLRSLLELGYITLAAAIVAILAADYRAARCGDRWLPVLLAIISVYGLTEAFILHLAYNVFLVTAFAELEQRQSTNCSNGHLLQPTSKAKHR